MTIQLSCGGFLAAVILIASGSLADAQVISLDAEKVPPALGTEEEIIVSDVPGEVLVRDMSCVKVVVARCMKEKKLIKDTEPSLASEKPLSVCQGRTSYGSFSGLSLATERDCQPITGANCWLAALQSFPSACVRKLYTEEAVDRLVAAEKKARDTDMAVVCVVLRQLIDASPTLTPSTRAELSPKVEAICRTPPPPLDTRSQ